MEHFRHHCWLDRVIPRREADLHVLVIESHAQDSFEEEKRLSPSSVIAAPSEIPMRKTLTKATPIVREVVRNALLSSTSCP